MEDLQNMFYSVVQNEFNEHLDYMNLDSETNSVPPVQNNKDTSEYCPFEFRSGSSPPRSHPQQISHVTHDIQAGSKRSNVSQFEDMPMEDYDQMADYSTIPTLINPEHVGETGAQFRTVGGSDDEHYLRINHEPYLLDNYRLPILDVLAEIKETLPVDHRQERKKREQHGYKSMNWEEVLHRAYVAVQAFLDARFEKPHANDFNTQGGECVGVINELSDTLTLNPEEKTNSTRATEEIGNQHELTTDSDNGSSSEQQVQRKLFLIIDKSGKASLKTNDPTVFSRLSRIIDLKRSAGTELNPYNKRRCTAYQLGMSGAVARQAIRFLISEDASHSKMEYPYTYLALNGDAAGANHRVSAIAATSSTLVTSRNQASHATSRGHLRNTAGGLPSKTSTHSAGSSYLGDKAGPNGKQVHGAENTGENSPADFKSKHSPPTSNAKDPAFIKQVIPTAAQSKRNYPAPIEDSGSKTTAGKHHTRSGTSFLEFAFDLYMFIVTLLSYGLIAYVFYKLNLHLILFRTNEE